jgi:hypothetical protein
MLDLIIHARGEFGSPERKRPEKMGSKIHAVSKFFSAATATVDRVACLEYISSIGFPRNLRHRVHENKDLSG